jgi:hypothetical protein
MVEGMLNMNFEHLSTVGEITELIYNYNYPEEKEV